MKRLFFHIGQGKTGSSALQSYLSFKTSVCSNELRLAYACLYSNKGVFTGDEITRTAIKAEHEYINSVQHVHPSQWDDDFIKRFQDVLKELFTHHDIVLFSCEDWIYEIDVFRSFIQREIFPAEVSIELLYYIRKPISWLNSGYWQWGAWESARAEEWLLDAVRNKINYQENIEAWGALPSISKFHVRLSPRDIVYDVLTTVGFSDEFSSSESSKVERVNMSLPPYLLRFYQRNRSFRVGPHTPHFDFIFNKFFDTEKQRPPLIIGYALQEEIMRLFTELNPRLPDYLNDEQKAQYLNDSEWYKPPARAHHKIESSEAEEDGLEVDPVIEAALESLAKGIIPPCDLLKELKETLGWEFKRAFSVKNEMYLLHAQHQAEIQSNHHLNQELQKRGQQLREQNTQKQEAIQRLNAQLREKDKVITSLREQNTQNQEVIQRLNTQLGEKEEVLHSAVEWQRDWKKRLFHRWRPSILNEEQNAKD